MPRIAKGLNPEARLQAHLARDIKLRQLEDHSKRQSEAVGVAKWENALNQKDERAMKKRMDEQIMEDSKIAKVTNVATRRQRLEELYQMDELRYEQELNALGLTFRKERI